MSIKIGFVCSSKSANGLSIDNRSKLFLPFRKRCQEKSHLKHTGEAEAQCFDHLRGIPTESPLHRYGGVIQVVSCPRRHTTTVCQREYYRSSKYPPCLRFLNASDVQERILCNMQ